MRCQDRKVPHMSGYHEHEECTAGTRLQRTHTCLRNRSNMDISSSQGNSRACLFEITDTLACMLAVKQALWQPSDWRRHLLREAYAPAVYRRVSQLPIRPAFLSHVRTWHKACASTVRVVEKNQVVPHGCETVAELRGEMAEEDGFDIGAKAEALLCMRYWDDGIDDDFDPTSWARGSLRPPVVGGTLELQNVRALIRRFQNGALKSVLKTLATAHTSRERAKTERKT